MKHSYPGHAGICLGLSLGILFLPGSTAANPEHYSRFAQQAGAPGVTPDFIYVEQLVDEIVARKRPFILDVRTAEEYQEAHIKGAVSIPLSEIRDRLGEIPRGRRVVLY